MDSGLQSTEQVIRCSHVCIVITLAIDTIEKKQGRAHCMISLTGLRVLFIGMKVEQRKPNSDLRVILILHVAILIRNLESNKDMTEIKNNYYSQEFNLIGLFDTNTGMFSNSSLEEELQQFKE